MPTKSETTKRLKKDPKSGIYQVQFRDVHGGRHQRSTGEKNLERARQAVDQSRLMQIEMQARAGRLTAESLTAIMAGGKVTCLSALEEWRVWREANTSPNTVRTQYLALRKLLAHLNAEKWPIAKLASFELIDGFINDPDDETGVGNRRSRLAAANSLFEFLTAKAYCVGNPAKLVQVRINDLSHEQKESKPRLPITEKEFKQIVANTEGIWRWWTELSYWAGLRLVDCACLEWASLLPDEIVVWTRKGQSRVALPIDDPLMGGGKLRTTFFGMMEKNRHPQFVFPEEREIALDPVRRAKHSVYYGRLLSELGIEGKSFHGLRHAFGNRLDAAGKTIEEIGRALGHAPGSKKTTKGYMRQG